MAAKKVTKKAPAKKVAKKQPKKVAAKAPEKKVAKKAATKTAPKKVDKKEAPAKIDQRTFNGRKKKAEVKAEVQAPTKDVVNPPPPVVVLQRTWDDPDNQQLQTFRRFVNAGNAGQVDREINFIKASKGYEVNVYDKLLVTIINTFIFSDENAAKEAIRYAEALNK